MIFVALDKKNGNSEEIDMAQMLRLLYGNERVEIKSYDLGNYLLTSFLSFPCPHLGVLPEKVKFKWISFVP